MAFLARLGVVLGLDSAEFSRGIDGANKRLTALAGVAKTSALAGAAAFAAMTAKALQYADAVADTAKANDMAIESILALGKGLRENGGDASNAARMLASFTSKVDEAAEGGKSAQVMFERIGVSLNDLAKMDITQLFDKTIESLAGIQDPIQRNALAIQAFGKAAKGVDFVGLASGSKEAREQFKEYAASIKDAADLHDELAQKASMMVVRFTKEVIPTILELYQSMDANTEATEGFWWLLNQGTKAAAMGVKYLVTAVQWAIVEVTALGKALKNFFTGNFAQLDKDYEEYQKRFFEIQKSTNDFYNKLYGDKPKPKLPTTPAPSLGRVVVSADDEAIKKAKELSAEYARQQMLKYEQVQRQTYLLTLSDKEKQIAIALFDIEDSKAQKLFEIDKKINEEKAKSRPSEGLIRALEQEKEMVELLAQAYKELTESEIKRQQELQNSFEFGWNRAFKQYAEDAENYAKLGQQSFEVFSNSISSAIDRFVESGKFSFNDFVRSILVGLLKIEMQMQAMQLFKSGKSWIQSLFGGGFTSTGGEMAYPNFAADGGMINGPTIVGENGPELFIPQTSGTVIPNQQLSSYGSSQPQVIYNGPYIANMSAIDTQSAAQFLAKNKTAVWAANQSAGRSVPASR